MARNKFIWARKVSATRYRKEFYEYRRNGVVYAVASRLAVGGGWYWYTTGETPLRNTAGTPVPTLEQAQADAAAYVAEQTNS